MRYDPSCPRVWAAVAAVAACLLIWTDFPTEAAEKIVLLDDLPPNLANFEVSPDGSRLYFGHGKDFYVFNQQGQLVDKYGAPTAARELVPLPNEWFVACLSHANGHLALYRPDGTYAEKIVGRGDSKKLRGDMTGWTSPCGVAVDAEHDRLFALDTTMAPRDDRNLPDPDWSRIAVFDLHGQYVNEINAYSAYADDAAGQDDRRTWYEDIEVDAERKRVYATSRRTRELLVFDYEGQAVARIASPGGWIAVFSDGRVAVGGGRVVQLFTPELTPLEPLKVTLQERPVDVRDLETDAQGRLYASTHGPDITWLRWASDLKSVESFGPRYRKIRVDHPHRTIVAGAPLEIRVAAEGRPTLQQQNTWSVLIRPSAGRPLEWQSLPCRYSEGVLTASTARELRGLYEVAVRFGEGPIAIADRSRDLYLQTTVCFVPPDAQQSVSAFTPTGRRTFLQDEAVPLHLVLRSAAPAPTEITVRLEQAAAPCRFLATATCELTENLAVEIPAEITARLAPGSYVVRPEAEACECYPLQINIAPSEPDSTMQRILYHEFGTPPATAHNTFLADTAEEMDYIRRHAEAVARLGFSRETDRLAQSLVDPNRPTAWRRNHAPADLSHTGLPTAESLAIPHRGTNWQAEYYLDEAARFGIRFDTQLLGHCDGVRFRDWWLGRLAPTLQRVGQWLGRYPALYGFNYNDEMFFGGWAQGWTQDDKDWLERIATEQFADRPRADVYRYALCVMYDRFNEVVRQANPRARITTTPMWQFPAVEGSYAPEIYRGMSESYSHYLSEGYHYPWYPAHSAEFLRRPGLPLMGVFDNGHGVRGGDLYAKNLMQVISRGVQGVGVTHTKPFQDPWGADVYRVANGLAQAYGPLLAEAPPANEAAVLYSYTQDVTERRNNMGTPHWERVFELYGAGLMAGVPMQIIYEEDIRAGWLLADGRPRVPMLFFVGQVERLPAEVEKAVAAFIDAGGLLIGDADTYYGADVPQLRITKLDFSAHRLKRLYHEGYAADTIFPLFQPVLEDTAQQLRRAVNAHLRFPMQTDDPWVSKNGFDGGTIRYISLAEETSPFPWDAPTVWSLGAMYCKSHNTYLPKRTRLTLPAVNGVIYDVFEQKRVEPIETGDVTTLDVDLRHFPGKLYAVTPTLLGAPQVRAGVDGSKMHYQVHVVDDVGRRKAARVPLRLRLSSGEDRALDVFRATEASGEFTADVTLPMTADEWTLEVTELLGGRSTRLTVSSPPMDNDLIVPRTSVEIHRPEQIRGLIGHCGDAHPLTLVLGEQFAVSESQQEMLKHALEERGVRVAVTSAVPERGSPGVSLVVDMPNGGNLQTLILRAAQQKGLLDYDVTRHIPGPGRGFATAVFSPQADREHCVALIGGDTDGLARTIERFAAWLPENPQHAVKAAATDRKHRPREYPLEGTPSATSTVHPLSKRIGVKLSGVRIAPDSRHLLVASEGYWNNLAVVEDAGATARVVRSVRAGQSPKLDGMFIGAGGQRFAATARTTARFGEAFHLFGNRPGQVDLFPAFGDVGRKLHGFGVSEDGRTVIAAGSYGVVCWRREGNDWREVWARDYWQEFPKLDWPVSDVAARIPQFHAYIPRGADFALLLFGEFSNNGWVKPENFCSARLEAVGLADGSSRWTFDVPIPKTQLFPTLHVSPAGTRTLLQVQCGSWREETYRYFTLQDGQSLGQWDAAQGASPLAVAVADSSGRIAIVMRRRLLEIRAPDGTLCFNAIWPSQPVSVAFARDGESLFVADDAGCLTMLGVDGATMWKIEMGCVGYLAAADGRIYAACWDGQLRSFDESGQSRWTCDLTPAMTPSDPMAALVASADYGEASIWQAQRGATTSPDVPRGDNLLATGAAKLTVGGTRGWMSEGKVQIVAEQLTNGKTDDGDTPWLHLDELFWDSQAGRPVWAEITFDKPTDVGTITVYENPEKPHSWPTEGLVQVWNEPQKRWDTAAFGVFLDSPVNTYAVDLRQVSKIRYLPWADYYRNFHTSEIEVRGPTSHE